MSTLSLRLPDSLHVRLRALAARDGISINQLVTLAAAEKVAAILTLDYLEARARAADLPAFARLLARVPNRPAAPGDALPEKSKAKPAASEIREPRRRYRAKGSTSRAKRTKSR